MRLAILATAAAILLVVGGGCRHHNLAGNSCQSGCRHHGLVGNSCREPIQRTGCGGPRPSCDRVPRLPHGEWYSGHMNAAGPATAAYAYPYYTTRGPRDFLLDSPPTLGR